MLARLNGDCAVTVSRCTVDSSSRQWQCHVLKAHCGARETGPCKISDFTERAFGSRPATLTLRVNNFSTLAARRVRCRRRKKSSPRACAASSTTYASRRISSAATSKGTIGNHQQERWFGKSCAVERAIFLQKSCQKSISRAGVPRHFCTKPSVGVFTAKLGGFPY